MGITPRYMAYYTLALSLRCPTGFLMILKLVLALNTGRDLPCVPLRLLWISGTNTRMVWRNLPCDLVKPALWSCLIFFWSLSFMRNAIPPFLFTEEHNMWKYFINFIIDNIYKHTASKESLCLLVWPTNTIFGRVIFEWSLKLRPHPTYRTSNYIYNLFIFLDHP